MSYSLYEKILVMLGEDPAMQPRRQTHNLVHLERRLLITLYICRTGISFKQCEVLVGQSNQAIGMWFWQIVEGLIRMKKVSGLYLPTDMEELKELARAFEAYPASRLPNAVVAFDGTHIAVAAPNSDLSYLGQKGNTINVQAAVDANFLVRDVFYERGHCPGAMNDKDLFHWSSAKVWMETVHKFNRKSIGGIPIGFFGILDGGYSLRPGMIIPFQKQRNHQGPLPNYQREFNYRLSSSRMVVEEVFGMIKGRSPILRNCTYLKFHPEKVLRMFVACCVIHNFCILDGNVQPRIGMVHNGTLGSEDLQDVANQNGAPTPAQQQLTEAKQERMAIVYYLSQIDYNA